MTRQGITKLFFFIFAAALIVSFAPAQSPAADSIPRISIQELKEKIDRGEPIVILDVRSGADYEPSKVKITGAVRIPLSQLNDRYGELPKDREIIAYCT